MTDINREFNIFLDKIANIQDWNQQKVLYNRMTRLSTKTRRDDADYSYLKLALLHFQQGNYKKAEQKLNKSIQISPDQSSIYQKWLSTLYFGRKLKEAINFANKYYHKFGGTYPLENNLGMCYLHFEDYKTAIECFRMASMRNQGSRLADMNWALALYLKGESFEARKALKMWNSITAYEVDTYQNEIANLKEHLEKEISEEVREKMKAKIEGFEYILQEMREKQKMLNDGVYFLTY